MRPLSDAGYDPVKGLVPISVVKAGVAPLAGPLQAMDHKVEFRRDGPSSTVVKIHEPQVCSNEALMLISCENTTAVSDDAINLLSRSRTLQQEPPFFTGELGVVLFQKLHYERQQANCLCGFRLQLGFVRLTEHLESKIPDLASTNTNGQK